MTNTQKYEKTIICLANSRKPGGKCVAGKELQNGKIGAWIRPINTENNQAISDLDLQYTNGKSADVLDIVTIRMIEPVPQGHQKENHRIDSNYYWEKQSRATWAQVVSATDTVNGSLWQNGNSSFHGFNDKVTKEQANNLTNSLLLIKPTHLDLIVGIESQYTGGSKRKIRAKFKFNSINYNFVVTDPWIEAKYFARNDGIYSISESRLCISLAEIINGIATKLVATVITQNRVGETS